MIPAPTAASDLSASNSALASTKFCRRHRRRRRNSPRRRRSRRRRRLSPCATSPRGRRVFPPRARRTSRVSRAPGRGTPRAPPGGAPGANASRGNVDRHPVPPAGYEKPSSSGWKSVNRLRPWICMDAAWTWHVSLWRKGKPAHSGWTTKSSNHRRHEGGHPGFWSRPPARSVRRGRGGGASKLRRGTTRTSEGYEGTEREATRGCDASDPRRGRTWTGRAPRRGGGGVASG